MGRPFHEVLRELALEVYDEGTAEPAPEVRDRTERFVVRRQRTYFQEKLMPEYDDRLVLDYVLPTIADAEARLKAMQARPETVMVGEWREIQGLPAWGDKRDDLYLVPTVGTRAVRSLDELE